MKPFAKYLLLAAILMATLAPAHGQMNATMYHMKDTPFNNQLNPAFQPTYGSVFVGLGPLASMYFDAHVYGENANYNNLLSNSANLGALSTHIKDYAAMGFGMELNLINVGILVDRWYFTFDTKVRADIEGRVNGDIFRLAWYGNGADNTMGKYMGLGNTGGASSGYTEVAMGASYQLIEKILTVGGKLKYLQGAAYAEGGLRNGSYFYTDPNNYNLEVQMLPYIELGSIPITNKTGHSVPLKDVLDEIDMGQYQYQPNHGFAVDLGSEWQVMDKLKVSASILDLGFIRWRNVVTIEAAESNKPLTFDGIDLGDQDFFKHLKTQMTDSILVNVSARSGVARMLSPKFYIGANYELMKHLNAGALLGLRLSQYEQQPMAALSVNTQGFMVNTSLSASYYNGKGNVGLGLLFGRRIVQFHLIADNLLGAINYGTAQNANLRFGLNLLFGHGTQNSKPRTLRNNAIVEAGPTPAIMIID